MPLTTAAAFFSAPTGVFVLDDTQMSTASTTNAQVKSFRIYQPQSPISSLLIYVSAWNANSSTTTTVYIAIDGGSPVQLTTTSTSETVLSTQFALPSTQAIHTITIGLSTSNASYSAYTQLLQVM